MNTPNPPTSPTPPAPKQTRTARHNYLVQQDIRRTIEEIQKLHWIKVIQTGWPDEVVWPVVTRMVICIRDLVAKSQMLAQKRIDFTDDVIIKDRVKDAASLIRFLRDALCHVESPGHMLDETNILTFSIQRGKGVLMSMPGMELGCDYDDDIAFIFGNQRVYYSRHLLRAFRESVANLQDFLNQDFKTGA